MFHDLIIVCFITLHARARGKAIAVRLSVVITEIARSRVLRIYVCCNYHELVGIGKKNWLLCDSNWRIWLTSATNCAFFVQHACGLPTAPTLCAYLTRLRMLDLDAGKVAKS